mmetsp:Transcript_124598/g.347002  ORF Transcript_124598/g.347002 Transcript_124598/m.347002 type:complete len:217 (+) Transcript_124598:1043-1693(+)
MPGTRSPRGPGHLPCAATVARPRHPHGAAAATWRLARPGAPAPTAPARGRPGQRREWALREPPLPGPRPRAAKLPLPPPRLPLRGCQVGPPPPPVQARWPASPLDAAPSGCQVGPPGPPLQALPSVSWPYSGSSLSPARGGPRTSRCPASCAYRPGARKHLVTYKRRPEAGRARRLPQGLSTPEHPSQMLRANLCTGELRRHLGGRHMQFVRLWGV